MQRAGQAHYSRRRKESNRKAVNAGLKCNNPSSLLRGFGLFFVEFHHPAKMARIIRI